MSIMRVASCISNCFLIQLLTYDCILETLSSFEVPLDTMPASSSLYRKVLFTLATGVLPSSSIDRPRLIQSQEKHTHTIRARLALLQQIKYILHRFPIDFYRVFLLQLTNPGIFQFLLIVCNNRGSRLFQRFSTRGQYLVNPRKVIHSPIFSGMRPGR